MRVRREVRVRVRVRVTPPPCNHWEDKGGAQGEGEGKGEGKGEAEGEGEGGGRCRTCVKCPVRGAKPGASKLYPGSLISLYHDCVAPLGVAT